MLKPLVRAVALALAAGCCSHSLAQPAFSAAWFANKGAVQNSAQATGYLPNGQPASSLSSTQAQQQKASEQLQRSLGNLNLAAQAIAAQQAAQQAARLAAANDPAVPDGLAEGGLKIDANSLTKGWINASAPVQSQVDGRTNVAIQQTADKAILNWETFNVGKNTTVNFQQQKDWAVLNRVNDPAGRPSQIQGQIKGDGTVLIVNRNGIVFSGSSQVDTRSLVAAAAKITDSQFSSKGLYVDSNGSAPTFTDAFGSVQVRTGALIATKAAGSSTQGGGYALLLGAQVNNAGQIVTPDGQTVLAAGDNIYIRKGVGTDGNVNSTTAGNEVSVSLKAGSSAGQVVNSGLILATTGDVTLTGHDVRQNGVVVATTSTGQRGTIHLSNRASDATGTVTLGAGATTLVLLDEASVSALDSQRNAALARMGSNSTNNAAGVFNNLSVIGDRRDLSRVEIVSGNTVDFQGNSLTLATGGEIAVSAVKRTLVDAGAKIDVSGAVGVKVAMEDNNLKINVQGNEQRDAPGNRDGKLLNNIDVWIDRRKLVLVPAGTNGYATDRWYTPGGLLEVSGYLGTSGHSVGEWMSSGGTVTVSGGDLVSRAGSNINLSGGTIDVASGTIRQSWLKGADGRLYEVSSAPADLKYIGIYQGYEDAHARWKVIDYYNSPLIGPQSRQESGYTVGRDAGTLIVSTANAALAGGITGEVYQGPQQSQAAQAGVDGYNQAQTAVARRGQLVVGQYQPVYDSSQAQLHFALAPLLDSVTLGGETADADGVQLNDAVADSRRGKLALDTAKLNALELGALRIAAKRGISVGSALQVAADGEIVFYAPAVDVAANLTARSGTIRLGNVLKQPSTSATGNPVLDGGIVVPTGTTGGVWVREGVLLDARGVVADLRTGQAGADSLAEVDGGTVSIRSTDSVTLAPGSVIDVSSGAAVQASGRVIGGRGGSVQLASGRQAEAISLAGNAAAVLTLAGDIRGYGVKGSGALEIESASAISIGGKLLATDGLLAAGELTRAGFILRNDYQVKAGEPLLFDYLVKSYTALPGETITNPEVWDKNVWYTLAADWVVPQAIGNLPNRVWTSDKKMYQAGALLPKGTVLQIMWFSGVVDQGAFPNGLTLFEKYPKITTYAAGQAAPVDVTVAAGTLLPAGVLLARSAEVLATTTLSPRLFQSGFSQYSVRGYNGLVIPQGVTLDANMPVLQANAAALASGTASDLLQLRLPSLYQADAARRTVSQRGGASLTLAAGLANRLVYDPVGGGATAKSVGDGGDLSVGEGARLRVDPGQSIALSSRGSLTVDGLLLAKGGSISLMGPTAVFQEGSGAADGTANQRAVVLGEHAVLDASAAAYVARDLRDRPYGLLSGGGSVVIGGSLQESSGSTRAIASDAFVAIRDGAVVDVSGGQAALDRDGKGTQTVGSDGGSIQIASTSGLYLDGSLRAQAGGAGAAGGRLTVALEAPNYALAIADKAVDKAVLAARELVLVQQRDRTSGAASGPFAYGHGVLGVDQVNAGGFSTLSLYSNGLLGFGGDVNLSLSKELRLYSGALTLAVGVDPAINVSLSAPYVRLAGITDSVASSDAYVRPSYSGGVSTLASQAVLTAKADLIDVKGVVTLGAKATVGKNASAITVERAGFGQLNLISIGDLRFVAANRLSGTYYDTELVSTGDIRLRAAQVYPATGVSASVQAGLAVVPYMDRWTKTVYKPDSHLVIERYEASAGDPDLPYAVFGKLTLGSAKVEQAGVLRAPLGTIQLGTYEQDINTTSVTLAPGSLTSVSAAGLVMPYGGTSDGVTYQYLGTSATLPGIGGNGGVTLMGSHIAVQPGATLDLSGGGDLRGAGFVSGRGGSTDARMAALMQSGSSGFTLPTLAGNPVYAIVPGYASAYAPAERGGAVDPLIGQQITIAANDIPGLAAGSYTLLPSTYALLPGAFRVEINRSASALTSSASAIAMRNGSYSATGTLSTANTGFADNQVSRVFVTPADVLRTYSQYNETSYAQFALADAKLAGTPRAALPTDGKTLNIRLPSAADSSFSFAGQANYAAAAGGYDGSLSIAPTSITASADEAIEVLGDGAKPTAGFAGMSLYAQDINAAATGANRMVVGGNLFSSARNVVTIGAQAGRIVLREGAILRAPEVFLAAGNVSGGITIETGAVINTIGMGRVAYDSTDGYYYSPGQQGSGGVSVVAASNGWLVLLAPGGDNGVLGSGPIAIGVCGATCAGTTQLYSEGTLLATTMKSFEMSDEVRYGTRNLVLSVAAVNAGSNVELAAVAARGALTPGLTLNQSLLDRLLHGDTAYGAPALERLTLSAVDSFNFFGTISLNTLDPATGKYSLADLVLTTPALYGYGQAGDVASLSVGKLTWAGLDRAAPPPIAGGRGSGAGRLQLNAEVIEFGYDAYGTPSGVDNAARTILGFADVSFNASERITANKSGSLSVYQSRTNGADGTPQYLGGNLTLTTPLLTGAGGSVNRITAGAALQVLAPASGAADAADVALNADTPTGAELSLAGNTVRIDTTVALPSGKLTVNALGDVVLGDSASLDLSGRKIALFDTASYSWGGDVILQSASGNILQAAGSTIDLSARNNNAGLLTAIALAAGAGRIDLQGKLLGSASGHYDAGGTQVPYRSGGVNLRAQSLGSGGTLSESFAVLNGKLNDGGYFGERSFQLKQGDLSIGNELKANKVSVSLDGGRLAVAGTIDASGEQVGSIRLAARDGLTLAGNALLDAHGTVLRVDSYGQVIDAPNRATVELDAGTGTLTLADGARIDLRHGTVSGGDGRNRGTLDLYAARIGSGGRAADADAATYGDIAIDARGSVDILGAKSIAVYGRQTYTDAPYGSDAAASGRPYQVIDQAYLQGKHLEATAFINAALANGGLLNTRLAALNTTRYANLFHLRPAVSVVSATADGDLIVRGDLDLSGYRYASLNPTTPLTGVYGSGEVGQLTLRAGGNLSIYGSINDGFAPPPATPDDGGWLLTKGVQAFGGDVVVPIAGIALAEGTTYPQGKTLNYAITVKNVTLPVGTTLPTTITLDSALTLPAGTVLAADVLAADGSVLRAAGSVVGAGGLTLAAGARLKAGSILPVAVTLASLTWPKGAKLPVAMVQSGTLNLPLGALIAAGTDVVLPADALAVNLRPADADGNQAKNWAVAEMLPAGSQSWNLRLIAGSDTQAADSRLTRPGNGNLVLADTHYTVKVKREAAGVWYWSDANYYGTPGTPVDAWALDPSFNVCEQDPTQCVKVSWLWSDGNYYGTPGAPVDAWALDPSYNVCEQDPSQCVAIGSGTKLVAVTPKSPVFSVVRTGTGDLDIAAGGDFSMQSPYGVYTAGARSSLGSAALDASYDRARGLVESGTVLGNTSGDLAAKYEALVNGAASLYHAWYPDGGGNLSVIVGGNLSGDSWNSSGEVARASSSVGNWLWRQGTGSDGAADYVPTAWWTNFGTYTYTARSDSNNQPIYWPAVTGFTGLGTLGGGNVSVSVGGDAGVINQRSTATAQLSGWSSKSSSSQGLVLAVGSSGRVLADGRLVLTGGGDLDLRIGGGWNSHAEARLSQLGLANSQMHELDGALVNLRGATTMSAGQIGTIQLAYGGRDAKEVRAANPYVSSKAFASGGLLLMEGDTTATVASRGDLVLGGTGNAGLVDTQNYTAFTSSAGNGEKGQTWFNLWTDRTAVGLLAAGGNLAFDTRASESIADWHFTQFDYASNGGWFLLPGNVSAVAATGSIYYGKSAAVGQDGASQANRWNDHGGLLLAPLGSRRIELLAGDSIYGGGYAISASGADQSIMATIFKPGFDGFTVTNGNDNLVTSNVSIYGASNDFGLYPLLAFGVNSVGSEIGLAGSSVESSRFYARDGDIVGLRTGSIVKFGGIREGQTDYVAAGPLAVRAGRDIVYTGTRADEPGALIRDASSDNSGAWIAGNLIVHRSSSDVSVVEAGRDILYANFSVAGPGTLEISAGRNIIQNGLASLASIGPVVASDARRGADIALQAGIGASDASYAGLLDRYLNPASLASAGAALADQPGKVAKTYENELVVWLSERYGFAGTVSEARSYFAGLAPEQQRVFARQIYFSELRAGGREYNDAGSPRHGSYLRGRNAIASLFPSADSLGRPIDYQGSLLMYGGSGIHTDLGGDVQVLTPGGAQTYGVDGAAPPSTAGLITRGQGNIQLYSLGSILLGQSRVMTTFGGDILAWSATGDINAGRGSKTTVVYTPPRRIYDQWGDVKISPDVPSTGAGIATLNPILEVKPGDVDLIAPLGTIDAGEAGIRVSGNVNIAALHVVNADNIQVQGKTTGIPMVAAVNVAALTNASTAASSAATAAQEVTQGERAAARKNLPSIFSVRVLGFGNDVPDDAASRQGANAASPPHYDPNGVVQVLGAGALSTAQMQPLTDRERRGLAP